MKELIDSVRLPGRSFQYYVEGNSAKGFRIRVVHTRIEKAVSTVAVDDREAAIRLADRMAKNLVYPSSLDDIMSDFEK